MIIDLTKLIFNNEYKVAVNGDIDIPNNYLDGTDIKEISSVEVTGFIYNNNEEYELDIEVKGVMTLECARTLKPVKRPFDIVINEVIDENNDNSLQIIQNRLDILPIIWENILVDVPLRVLHPSSKEETISGDGWKLLTEDEIDKNEIDPRLEKLKDYKVE